MQKMSFALFAVFLMAVPSLLVFDTADAESAPTEYDHDVDLGSFEYTTSSQAATWDLYQMGQDAGHNSDLTAINEIIVGADRRDDLSYTSYKPSWVVWSHPNSSSNRSYITVTPGAVCDDDYWILFDADGLKLLLRFHITVTDSGSVVPDPVGENTFTLRFDVHGGSAVPSMNRMSPDSQVSFDISDVVSEKEGYTFKGWAVDEEGESLLSGTVTVRISDGSDHALKIIHAVWEEKSGGIVIPTLFDGLIELFTNPVFLLIFIGGVFGLAYFIRRRQA